jgi:hypothetical protein
MAGSLTCVSVTLLVLCHGSVVGPSTPFLGAGISSAGDSLHGWSPHCCVSHAARAMSQQRGLAQHPFSWVPMVLLCHVTAALPEPHVTVP